MRIISTPKRVLTRPPPNAPFCHRCRRYMAPIATTAPVAQVTSSPPRLRLRRLELAVWLCETCGTKRPRFG
jgi:hypothetical protein